MALHAAPSKYLQRQRHKMYIAPKIWAWPNGERPSIAYINFYVYALRSFGYFCGAAESHSEICGDREGSEIVIPAHRNYRIALEAHNFRGYPPSAKILLP